MNTPFALGMARATDLTRAGKLDQATALIQALLAPKLPDPLQTPQRQPENAPLPDVLEGSFVRMDAPPDTPPTRPTGRASLARTLRDIASGGMPSGARMAGQPATAPPQHPTGAQFLSLTYRGAQGGRSYRLYVPAARADGPMPLVVMLHGCTQTPEDFANGTGMNALAEEFGCLIAWPAQPQGANAQKCWNWFRPQDQTRGQGEPAVIAGIVHDILRDHAADPTRVYVAGLSAGGAAAAILGATYPDVFAAVGVHSGLPVGSARDVPSAFGAMRDGARGANIDQPVPTIVFHGLADTTVNPRNGSAVIEQTLQGRSGLVRVHGAGSAGGGRSFRHTRHDDATGRSLAEHWEIDGAGHAWAGGHPGGSFTDPAGPDAAREMLRFFLQHHRS